jgi:hypothetical protein
MWSTEIQHVLWKACKTFTILFLCFLDFFCNFDETKQGEVICCWAWVTVPRWTCADRRICGALGRHTIWQQGLAINECRLVIVQSASKVQTQLLAKTCQALVQQGENKGWWKSTEQANNPEFSFFLIFSLIFPQGTSRNQTFLFFYYFFIFLWTRIKKEATTKIGTYN